MWRTDRFHAISHVRVLFLDNEIQVVMASYQLVQIGADIDGEAADDFFGWSVSMSSDGSTFVVGAVGKDGVNGTDSGRVRVYKLNSIINQYYQFGLDIDGEADSDEFGWSVSMSGDGSTFVVGAIGNDGVNGTDSGHVRVYKFNSTINTYAQVGLDIDGEAAGNRFGWSVSMSGDGSTFVVGSIFNNGIIGTRSGHVRVYKFNSAINAYAQVGLDIDGEAANDDFGQSVSMSANGTTFVVGARLNNGANGTDSGHVRVYKFNSTIDAYAQVGLDIDGEAANDQSGFSVSMSADGTTFIVGARLNNGVKGTDSGHVRVYKFNSTINTYAQFGLDIDGEAANDDFGRSVSMSADGTMFVVGGQFNNGVNGSDSGHVRVYMFNSTISTYDQVELDIDGESAGDLFGWSVSISADATTFVVGAYDNDGVSGTNSGHVRVYSTGVVRPTKSPTKAPAKQPTKAPTKSPTRKPTPSTMQPTKVPTNIPPENCGIFGWNVFCPRRGKCGLLKRLLNLGNCD